MNKELEEVIRIYCMWTHIELNQYLLWKSKDTVISIFNDLLTMYINDKNSSTLREFITVSIAWYKHSEWKIWYNWYKQNIPWKSISCEAKPKNFDTNELEKFKKKLRTTSPSKLNWGWNFTDYTWARLEKDKNENPNMLISGFVDWKLIYILEFPFKINSFIEKLEQQLKAKFPNWDIDRNWTFLRSATFDFRDYILSNKLKYVFILNKWELLNYKEYINKDFLEYLYNKSNNND